MDSGNVIVVKILRKIALSDSSVGKPVIFLVFYSILVNWEVGVCRIFK